MEILDKRKRPLVSICIPTYNRAGSLKKSLESIISQKEFLDGDVEIIVSDNASSDNTRDQCLRYMMFKNFHYYRNTNNIGDHNFPLALKRANGVLRKLCNDTLVFQEDSMQFFCEEVKKHQSLRPCLFFLNNSERASKKNVEVLNVDSFFKKVSYHITWIGGFAIWDKDCQNIEIESKSCELRLWQEYKLCELLKNKKRAIVYEKKFANAQHVKKKDVSYGLYQVFYENNFTILEPYVEQQIISTECLEFLKRDILFKFFTNWIIYWEYNNKDYIYNEKENLKELVFEKYGNKSYFKKYLVFYNLKKIKFYICRK